MKHVLLFLSLISLFAGGMLAPYRAALATSTGAGSACPPSRHLIAHGFGSPDDVAIDGSRILFGDIHAGVLASIKSGRVSVTRRGLDVPEGIVVLGSKRLVIVEQGKNRIDALNLKTNRLSVRINMRNDTGLEGVDAIGSAPGDNIYVPDSPYGTLYRLDKSNHLHLIIAGLDRPVDAIQYAGGVAVADENANAIWLVKKGKARRLATVPTPDDVAIVGKMLLAVTLGDNALWEIRPVVKRLMTGLGQPQGLATLSSSSVVVTDSNANVLYRITGLKGCAG